MRRSPPYGGPGSSLNGTSSTRPHVEVGDVLQQLVRQAAEVARRVVAPVSDVAACRAALKRQNGIKCAVDAVGNVLHRLQLVVVRGDVLVRLLLVLVHLMLVVDAVLHDRLPLVRRHVVELAVVAHALAPVRSRLGHQRGRRRLATQRPAHRLARRRAQHPATR